MGCAGMERSKTETTREPWRYTKRRRTPRRFSRRRQPPPQRLSPTSRCASRESSLLSTFFGCTNKGDCCTLIGDFVRKCVVSHRMAIGEEHVGSADFERCLELGLTRLVLSTFSGDQLW